MRHTCARRWIARIMFTWGVPIGRQRSRTSVRSLAQLIRSLNLTNHDDIARYIALGEEEPPTIPRPRKVKDRARTEVGHFVYCAACYWNFPYINGASAGQQILYCHAIR